MEWTSGSTFGSEASRIFLSLFAISLNPEPVSCLSNLVDRREIVRLEEDPATAV
jgi:hypothetical protein